MPVQQKSHSSVCVLYKHFYFTEITTDVRQTLEENKMYIIFGGSHEENYFFTLLTVVCGTSGYAFDLEQLI